MGFKGQSSRFEVTVLVKLVTLFYSIIEKQALYLVTVIAQFRTYVMSTHVIVYVPHSPVKMILNQQLGEGTWENWLAKLQEYDLEIKPLKVVKGKGLCKFMRD